MLPVKNSEAEAGGAPSVRGQPGPHSELQASLDCIVRPVLKDKILLHGYLGGHPFAVWRARRRWLQPGGLSARLPAQGGEQAEEGGAAGLGPGLQLRRKCPPARTSSAENAPARRPDLELAAPQPQPRSPAAPQVSASPLPRHATRVAAALASSSSSSLSPPPPPLRRLLCLSLLFSVLLRSFLSSLNLPLLPPRQTLQVVPESPGPGSPATGSCSRLSGMLLARVELPSNFCSVLETLAGVLILFSALYLKMLTITLKM